MSPEGADINLRTTYMTCTLPRKLSGYPGRSTYRTSLLLSEAGAVWLPFPGFIKTMAN